MSAVQRRRAGSHAPSTKSDPLRTVASAFRPLSTASGRLVCGLALAVIAVVGVVCYANVVDAPFTFDDESSITRNPFVKHAPSAGLWILWGWNPRRFLVYASFVWNYEIGGLQPAGYHAVNIALHIATAWMLFGLLLLMQRIAPADLDSSADNRLHPGAKSHALVELILAAGGAALFVSHPIQTSAVTYIVQRAAVLATAFYLLALLGYLRAAELRGQRAARARRLGLLTIALAAFVCGLLAKEIDATLPLAVLLAEVILLRTSWATVGGRLRRLLPWLTVVASCVIVWCIYRRVEAADVRKLFVTNATMPPGQYLLTQVNVARTYLRLLVLPIGQNLDYDYPVVQSLWEPRTWLSAGLLAGLVALAVRLRRRLPIVAFGIAFFFTTLLVESLIPLPDVIFEHRLYLPSAGFIMVIVGVVGQCAGRTRRPVPVVLVSFSVLVGVAGIAAHARNQLWRDPVALWADVVQKSPRKPRAHHNLANALEQAGCLPEAAAELRAAAQLNPGIAKVHNSLGHVYQRMGAWAQAEAAYQQAMAVDPKMVDARSNLGFLYIQMGRLDDAERVLLEATSLNWVDAEVRRGLGKLAYLRRQWAEAEQNLQIAVKTNPDSANIHNELGAVYYQQGRLTQAETEYRRAIELQPQSAQPYSNLGNVLLRLGRIDEAEAVYRHALELQPNDVDIQLNLAHAYQQANRWQEAEAAFKTVLTTAPNSAEALFGLAAVYRQLGREPDADAALERAQALRAAGVTR